MAGKTSLPMRRALQTVLVCVCAVLFASGCVKPSSYEAFVRSSDRGDDGLYRFTLDLSDTMATYDLSIYSRIDCMSPQMSDFEDISMSAWWTSPGGETFREDFFFPVQDSTSSDFYSTPYLFPFREDFKPVEAGEWKLAFDVAEGEGIPQICGMGIICKTKK